LLSLLDNLREQSDFEFGKPWRLTDRQISVVVPLIRKTGTESRGYVLLEEVKDRVKIEDTGSIDSLKMSGIDKPVLARSGLVLEGIGTQNRSIAYSKVIIPQAVVEVPVHCVHASHPIRTGARMAVSEISVPTKVALASMITGLGGGGGQHSVWDAARSYSEDARTLIAGRSPEGETSLRTESDNLIRSVRTLTEFSKTVNEVISKMPVDLKGQVGIAVIDVDGAVGLEMFDHPDSWLAASKAVARKYGDVLAKEGKAAASIFQLNANAVTDVLKGFLACAHERKERVLDENARARTIAFETKDVVGERALLDGNEIYVVAARRSPEMSGQYA